MVRKKAKKKVSKKADKGKIHIQISIIKEVPAKKQFILADGRKLKDVRELAFALTDMADDIFWHHVNDARNDFASWVGGVYKDSQLAEEISKARDKVNTQLAILKHIVAKL